MRLPAPARALLAAALTGVALAAAPAAPAAASSGADARPASADASAEVERLRAEVDRVGALLAGQAQAYEQAEDELAALTNQQFAARSDRDALADAEVESRSALQGLARAAYKGGMPPMVTALMSGDPRAVSSLAYVQRSVNRVGGTRSTAARDLAVRQAGAEATHTQADVLRRQALSRRQALEVQREELAAETARLTRDLQAAGTALVRARAAEDLAAMEAQAQAAFQAAEAAAAAAAAATGVPYVPGSATGGTCGAPSGADVNGFLSPSTLCPLSVGGGHRLRTDAARAFEALSAARTAASGAPLCVTDSYRDYAGQVSVFARKPGLAATPGRSQHGWGLAVDFCGGVQGFGSEAHRWMQANAPAFGWVHPAWARQGGSRPEAWHWEYVGVVRAAG